jgi:hypothetical protein
MGDPAIFNAIVAHDQLDPTTLTTDEKRQILTEVDRLQAVSLPSSGSKYSFDYIADRKGPHHVKGTIDTSGTISVTSSDPTSFPPQPGGCPICLAALDVISTLSGSVLVTNLRVGMLVWTEDSSGHRTAEPVLKVAHVEAPPGHHVVRLTLNDGRTVEASPSHPTADGRVVGDLAMGDVLDGATVTDITLMPYSGYTWDLLPAGPTGVYWANDILLKSTLRDG